MGPTTRGVHLFARNHVTRAHCVLRAFAIFASTLSNSHAAQSRMCKAAIVVGKLEISWRVPWVVVRTETQVLINVIRIDDFSRVHHPIGIPDGFEFAKSLDQLRPEHLVEEFGFRLSVAMLAGDRTAIAGHKVGGLLHERSPFANSRLTHEVEIESAVNTALSEMPI